METKICSRCGIEKSIDMFRNRSYCKQCENEISRSYKLAHKAQITERNKQYREENKEKVKLSHDTYRKNHPDAVRETKRKYRANNEVRISE